MIVGESISSKIDSEERRLRFKVPETEDPSAVAWRTLIDVDDDIRPLKDLDGGIVEDIPDTSPEETIPMVSADEFLVDDEDDMDADLTSYPPPESDAEDSDDDPTLISREKTPTPLYVLRWTY
jgi:telomere length regulation protein